MVEEVTGAGEETGKEVKTEAEKQDIEAMKSELSVLRAKMAEAEGTRERLALAVAKYRAQLLSAAPEIPEELVKGESVEEVDAAFSAAHDLVERVRRKLEAQVASARVPAGAPARSGPDLSALSPKEKIAYALGIRKG